MYVLVNYEYRNLDEIQISNFEIQIKKKLSDFKWVKPTQTLFVIECFTEMNRLKIIQTFRDIGSQNILFMVTKIIQGKLSGITSKNVWDVLNSIAKNVDEELEGMFDDE